MRLKRNNYNSNALYFNCV